MIFVILVKNAVDYVSKKKRLLNREAFRSLLRNYRGKEENSFKKFISYIFFFFFF